MNRIKELRLSKGLKQSDIADLVNVRQTTVSHWENEATEIDRQSMFKLADFFGVTIDYLLGKSDTPNPPELVIPDILKNIPVAFHRGEFEDLTQDEVDALAVIAGTLKAQRRL